ncbi:hypothetical protein ACFJI0_26575 [Hydrogenophaga sp. UC242_53]|uniref:hypothetical protein n=1 Tax=Hydrogenophaga sp. UC242_53 TaxID=3350170 RepID=UPI0036D42F49
MKHLCLAAAWALLAGAGHAQAPATPPTVCSQPGDMAPSQLYGLWQLVLWPQEGGSEAAPASTGALLFERHPEYPDSVRGSLKRSTAGNDRQAVVSGDVMDGEFNLDESADGVAHGRGVGRPRHRLGLLRRNCAASAARPRGAAHRPNRR